MQLDLPFLQVPGAVASPPGSVHPPAGLPPPGASVHFVRVRRARRYILRVKPDGSLRVTVPRGGSQREAREFVERNRRWIERERQRVLQEHAPREWHNGTAVMLDGQEVPLVVSCDRTGRMVVCYGVRSTRARSATGVRDAVEADLRKLAKDTLVSRLRELAVHHGLRLGTISIRNQRSRWGSCAKNGNIALNFRLVQMPPHVRDYVLIHELMHLRQQNHSRRFWRLVESACPGFREAERWLRTTGRALF